MGYIVWFIVWILLCFVAASAAKRRGRSFGGYLVLSIFLSPLIGLIVVLVLGETEEIQRSRVINVNLNTNMTSNEIWEHTRNITPNENRRLLSQNDQYLSGNATSNIYNDQKKCPYCAELIKKEAIICRFCGRDIAQYENEQIMKLDEEKKKKELEIREKYKSLEDLFNDTDIMEQAKKLRRTYGKDVYISHLKTKAKELGLGDIDLNENDID